MTKERHCVVRWMGIMLFLLMIVSGGAITPSVGGERSPQAPLRRGPIEIQSDEVVANNQTGRIVFTGRVEAQQGDLQIFSPQMEVIYDQKERQVAQVIASGGVKIQRGDQTATAEKAVFSNREQKIVLTGHPKAWEKKNEITGMEMILFLQEDRVVVNGGEQRVRVVLYPEEAELQKKDQKP